MLNKDDYMIWCTCHNENIPKEYNLYNSEHFTIYNNDIRNFKEDNINYLHDFFRELTTYYYVWKNQIKSDYVGFCHYSKHFSNIDYNILNNFGFYAYDGCLFNPLNFLYRDSVSYEFYYRNMILYLKYKYNINLISYSKNIKEMFSGSHNMYIFTWDMFNDVCDFMFGFLNYICPNEQWKILSNLLFLTNMFHTDNNFDNNFYFKTHGFPLFFEWWIGVYLGIISKYNNQMNNEENINSLFYINNDKNKRNKYFIFCNYTINNDKDINKLIIFIKQNIKSGIVNYCLKCNKNNKKYLDLEYLYNYYHILNVFVYNIQIYENNYQYNEAKNKLLNENFNIIELNINERIHCDNSIEIYKGNYYIEKIPNTSIS